MYICNIYIHIHLYVYTFMLCEYDNHDGRTLRDVAAAFEQDCVSPRRDEVPPISLLT